MTTIQHSASERIQTARRQLVDLVRRAMASPVHGASPPPKESSAATLGPVFALSLEATEILQLCSEVDAEIDDLVHHGGRDLSRRATALQRALRDGAAAPALWALARSYLAALRNLGIALEMQLAEVLAEEPLLTWEQPLGDSLAVRRAYGGFRLAVAESSRVLSNLTSRLRSVSTALAVLRGSDVYPSLRHADRAILKELHERIRVWLTGEQDSVRGRRLLQDVESFAQLLQGVNLRTELQIHDREQLLRLHELIRELRPDEPVSAELAGILDSLHGRDLRIDRLLFKTEPLEPGQVLEIVAHLEEILPNALPAAGDRGAA